MNRHEPNMVDDAEERNATFALCCAKDKDELMSAWWAEADHFTGAARERLQDEYAARLREVGVALE